MASWRWSLIVVGVVVIAGMAYSLRPRSYAPPPPSFPEPGIIKPGPSLVFTGTDSCSGRACHGALEARAPDTQAVLQDEYTRWLLHDPHVNAYDVLLNERSRNIARNLAGPGQAVKAAHEDQRCLACHSTPAPLAAGVPTIQGVGCESCHGPAGKWLDVHVTASWKAAKKFEEYGMIPVGETADCAKSCAGCHVGAAPDSNLPAHDVNHDLIAAGHPRLNFEYAAYRANLPPHWNVKVKKKSADEDARSWAVGQVVSAEQALELLAQRAKPENKSPWPEFAEYDCFACHHSLGESWRQQRGYGSRLPGALPWGTWYFSMAEQLATEARDTELVAALQKIRQDMEKPTPKYTASQDVLQKLARFRTAMGKQFNQESLWNLLRNEQASCDSWDMAEQFFQAACALYPSDQPLPMQLQELEEARAFARHFDSPKGFDPGSFLKQFRGALKQVAPK